MKKQDKNLQQQLNEEEMGNLYEKEFRVMRVKMIQSLGKRMETQTEKLQEMFNKEIKDIKNRNEQDNNWNEKYTKSNQ